MTEMGVAALKANEVVFVVALGIAVVLTEMTVVALVVIDWWRLALRTPAS